MGGSSSSSKTSSTTSNTQQTTSGASSPQYNAGGDVQIDTSPTVTAQAFNAIQQLVGQALSTQGTAAQTATQTVQNQAGDLSNLVSAVLAQDQSTTANTASGGQTNTDSTVLWVVGIAAAALAGIMIFSRK